MHSQAIETVLRTRSIDFIRESPLYAISYDGTKAADRFSRDAICLHGVSADGQVVKTLLGDIIKVGEQTGLDGCLLVFRFLRVNDIAPEKMVGVAADGGGNCAGKNKGSVARVAQLLPWVVGRSPICSAFVLSAIVN